MQLSALTTACSGPFLSSSLQQWQSLCHIPQHPECCAPRRAGSTNALLLQELSSAPPPAPQRAPVPLPGSTDPLCLEMVAKQGGVHHWKQPDPTVPVLQQELTQQ